MHILVIDESEKKAWVKSRRILAASLYRRGSRAFTGRLSAEGLKELITALKKVARKNTCIGIFQLTANADFQLIQQIGKEGRWGEEGYFAHRVSSRPAPRLEGFSAVDKLLRSVIRLSALFHDIGKANEQFQLMLRGKSKHQHIRHELVSYLLLRELSKRNSSKPFLELLAANPAHYFSTAGNVLDNLEVPVTGFSETYFQESASTLLSSLLTPDMACVENAVYYLVLTHHRQVAVDVKDTLELRQLQGAPSFHRYLNQVAQGATFDPKNLTFSADGLPWQDAAWLASVKANAQSILQLFNDNPHLQSRLHAHAEQWAKSVALIARPALIQADHLGSAMKEARRPVANLAYANSVDRNGVAHLADSLTEHLMKVRYASDPFFKGLSGNFKELPTWNVPKDSPIAIPVTDPRYKWQEDAEKLVAAIPDIENRPFFGMVVAGTGAGKTLVGPRTLSAASGGRLRYTCALGLRSLTLQTGTAYRKVLKISEADGVTVIGDALYAQLAGDKFEQSSERHGSESLEELGELLTDHDFPAGSRLGAALEMSKEQLDKFADNRKSAMLNEVPVLTCTVDIVIRASSLSGGKDTRMSLRLATSDLVLDEIDAYSLEDLQALGRLVHQAGCHGRRVLLMSATVSQTVLQALYNAWLEGLKVWEFHSNRKASPVVALLSNQVPCEVVDTSVDDVSTRLDSFMAGLSSALSSATRKNKVKTLPLGKTKRETFDNIVEQAIEFARVHNTADSKTGERFSTGFVRFNRVEDARKFFRYVVDNSILPGDISLQAVCYHREHSLLLLSIMERAFNEVLIRKDPQAVFSSPRVANWNAPGKLRILLVCTTSIQETGRDHDYDFAIAEPWSTRSSVQLGGRVLRHRNLEVLSPNIAILEGTLDIFNRNSRSRTELDSEYIRPKSGLKIAPFSILTNPYDRQFQSAWKNLTLRRQPANFQIPEANNLKRSDWFFPEFFSDGITAQPCLRKADASKAALSYLEHFAQEIRMYRPEEQPGLFSMADLFRTSNNIVELCWNRHNEVVKFRRQNSRKAQFTLNPLKRFKEIGVVQKHAGSGALEVKPLVIPSTWSGGTTIKNLDRCFIRTDLITYEEAMKELGTNDPNSVNAKLGFSFELYEGKNGAFSTVVDYDPLLGASNKSSYLEEGE